MDNQNLFTKSAFKMALHCPMQAYYSRNKEYENQSVNDEFLKSLAEGGFQVGAIAKIYGNVSDENDLGNLHGYDAPLGRTRELFGQDTVNIAEAAFQYRNCFVRADIIQKDGNNVNLIEVKAKSWETGKPFLKKDNESIDDKIWEYVYDVAFQKWVVSHALKELYPDQPFTVRAFLMLADKTKVNSIPKLNALFRIKKGPDGRTCAEPTPEAQAILAAEHEHVIVPFDVDKECDMIIEGRTGEQIKYMGKKFEDFVQEQSERYVKNEKVDQTLGAKCFKCPFTLSEEGKAALKKSGFVECWKEKAHFSDADFDRPLIKDLNGTGLTGKNSRDNWIKEHIYFISDITEKKYPSKSDGKPGLSTSERKWLHINSVKQGRNEPEILKDELKVEMQRWKYPLHMIDFETTASALPYHTNLRPYENIAFQFSHHIIKVDGTIEHAGQFLDIDSDGCPNFTFVRELKKQLEQDDGSVFRYSHHENTILNGIHEQLAASDEKDKDELMAFIKSITHGGERDMIDLCDIVKRFYWHPSMKGSNSIKQVLPAVLQSSSFLQEKYGKPIYGSTIKSLNYTADTAIALLTKDESGNVQNPYKVLPTLGEIEDAIIERLAKDGNLTNDQLTQLIGSSQDEDDGGFEEDTKINNGGLPLVVYRYLQTFPHDGATAGGVRVETIREALLRYCELDTMAMVLIWEYFAHECGIIS
ncbi:MAG: DUF2779 domain-containing protein [Treponema sp.]|nr:DUF2779 domain-containing protein [Treponema sp.]